MSDRYEYDTGAFLGECALCHDKAPKRSLDRVMLKSGSYGSPKILAYICRDCLPRLAEFLEADVPDIDSTNHRLSWEHYCHSCYTIVSRRDRFCKQCGLALTKEETGMTGGKEDGSA